MLRYLHVKFAELGQPERDRWEELRAARSELHSPYFHLEFADAVAEIRDDVEVAIIEVENEIAGILPYQRRSFGRAVPLGGRLSDFQAVIGPADLDWCPCDLLKSQRLNSLKMHHWIHDDTAIDSDCIEPGETGISPVIDLSAGYDEWYGAVRRHNDVKRLPSRYRRAETDGCPARFEWHSTDPHVLQSLYKWKAAQFEASGFANLFDFPWVAALLDRIRDTQHEDFAGVMSALYLGDELAAVHFGMRSRDVMHIWFTTYNPEFRKYSPGVMILQEIAKECARRGMSRLDLGWGDERYKHSFSNAEIPMASIGLSRPTLVGMTSRAVSATWRGTKSFLRSGPLKAPANAFARSVIRPVREWMSFR